jgi:hypothetical protein
MTLSALGIFSAAGAGGGGATGTYELIETVILGSSQSAITFSNLGTYSSTYKHLQIRSTSRSAGADAGVGLRFNGDTGNNYSFHALYSDGSSTASVASTSRSDISVTYIYSAANVFTGAVVDILDPYSTTKNKTVRSLLGPPFISLFSGAWYNTASVTSITLTGQAQSFAAGSRVSLYGIR